MYKQLFSLMIFSDHVPQMWLNVELKSKIGTQYSEDIAHLLYESVVCTDSGSFKYATEIV